MSFTRAIFALFFTASYSDSYSSDEDDVSPRERTQVSSQVYFCLKHNLLPLTLLVFACP